MGSAARRGHPRRILDIAGAAVAALLAFTAVPAVLVAIVGNPLAGGLGHAWRPLPRDALCFLVLAAWVAWAACCAQLLRAVVTDVRRGEVGVRHGSSVLDRVAARIAFGVLALTTLGAPLSLAAGAGASAPVGGGPSSSLTAALPVGAAPSRGGCSGPELFGAAGRHAVAHRGRSPGRRGGLDVARRAQSRPRRRRRGALRRSGPAPGGVAPPPPRGRPPHGRRRRRRGTSRRQQPGVAPWAGGPSARIDRPRTRLAGLRRLGPARRVATPNRRAVQRRPRPRILCHRRAPWTRRPCCTASTVFRRCIRSRPPIACWACPWRAEPPARRSGPSASRTPASPSVSPARPQKSLPPASCAPRATPRGTSATLLSRVTTSRSRTFPSCFPSATMPKEPGSSPWSRALCCPSSERRHRRCGVPPAPRSDPGPGPRRSS